MDVNGTRFHLVLGREGWLGDGRAPDGLAFHAADHTLRLAEVPFVFPERTGNRRLGPGDRRGADRDRYGNWYWIGPDRREVRFQAAGTRGSARFWPQDQLCLPDGSAGDFGEVAPPPPVVAQRLAGLAVTAAHHLVVGAPDLPGVLIFDLSAGGPPASLTWPVGLSPVDMAAAPDGGVWILDDQPGPGGAARYWCLDRHLRIGNLAGVVPAPPEPPEFEPVGPVGPGRPRPPAPVASPAEVAAEWAVAIEALPDGSVLVLDRGRGGPARVLHLRGGRELGQLPLTPLVAPIDFAYTPDPYGGPAGTLYVAEDQGDQAFAYHLAADASALTPLTRYLPMRLFSGKALVAAGGQVFYDLDERWLALADRRSPRYRNAATLDLGPFDATEPGTVWHRLTIDGRIPPGTSVRVWSRVADEAEALAHASWREEPAPYLRGLDSELSYHRFGAVGATDAGTFELLLQRAVGRHLELRLAIAGDGRHTPRLWALRAHRPRFSYLQQYLPDLYQEDPDAADFLDRYLANVEGLFTALEGRIEGAQVLFGVTSLDARYLGWLGGWLGAAVDPAWDEARVRLLLQHAVELFGRRGTVRGLVEAIRLATDPCPDSSIFDGGRPPTFAVRVVESFRTRPAPGAAFAETAPLAGPRVLETGQRWRPADGRLELDRRYREFVVARHGSLAELERAWGREVATGDDGPSLAEPFPPLTPTAPVEAADRAAFVVAALAVTYAEVTGADLGAYRGFLAQRYRDPAALSASWGLVGGSVVTSFAEVELPSGTVPPDGRPLLDWIQFVAAYLPALRAAHRFSVLVPVRLGDSDAARAERLARATEVVVRERPAHTAFQVRPYWAAFRVGEARVGLETSVAEGSRFVALVLGEGRMAQAYVGGGHPWDLPDRWVVGRDRVRLGAGDGATEATDA